MTDDLPGDPRTWTEFRAALKKLMARAEMTAVAVERLSVDPEARRLGVDSIGDATVGRKIAAKDEPVDARAVRAIVVTCGLAAARRGVALADADVHRWLRARTRLAEGVVAPPVVHEEKALGRSFGSPWVVGALVALLIVTGGAVLWTVTGSDRRTPPVIAESTGGGDDLVTGRPPCVNPPDKPTGTGLAMTAPTSGLTLTGDSAEAAGTVTLAPGESPPWLLLYAPGDCKFYLVGPVAVSGDTWAGTLYVDPTQRGSYGAYVVVVDNATDERLHRIAESSRSPFIVRLPTGARVVHVTVRCCA